jgi:hypothetical protein
METLEHYWELTGTAAITLLGLLFVVITLGAERRKRGDEGLLPVFLTPTIVHFGVVFLMALVGLSPERDSLVPPFGLVGLAGLVYCLAILRNAIRADVGTDALVYHGVVPTLCYAGIIVAALPGLLSVQQAILVLRVDSAILLFVGMRNAWAAAIDIAGRERQ